MAKKKSLSILLQGQRPKADPFGALGNLPAGTRIKRGRTGKITEDDPRWNPKTMGNKRGR
jgi:hypothetical protein